MWLGMWANPGDIIPLIKDGKTVHWLVLGGEIVNWSGETVRVAGPARDRPDPGRHDRRRP